MKEDLINTLKLQREIFGDELYSAVNLTPAKKQTTVQTATPNPPQASDNNLFEEMFQKAENLSELDSLINKCSKCALGKSRTKFVFGAGNPNADVMLIGEAPGAEEDRTGIPFVGAAGNLLDKILKAIDFKREDVFIANILKCRPPSNRDPLPSERDLCIPYLYKQIDLIKPKLILCLGRIAGAAMINQKLSLTKMRGRVFEVRGIKTMVTYHPAALLRNYHWKPPTWEDVQQFKKLYDQIISEQ